MHNDKLQQKTILSEVRLNHGMKYDFHQICTFDVKKQKKIILRSIFSQQMINLVSKFREEKELSYMVLREMSQINC